MSKHTLIARLFASSMTLALLNITPAHAQFSTNSNEPVTGSADDADYQAGLTVLSGQVDVRQGSTRVLADVMKIHSQDNTGSGQGTFNNVDRIEALGNFYFLTPDQEVRGQQGIYERKTDTFTVSGDVILVQNDSNIVTGETLTYNLSDNSARVAGSCKGRRCGSNGRVSILIKNTRSTS